MFVGDKGKILGSFQAISPGFSAGREVRLETTGTRDRTRGRVRPLGLWIEACKGGKPTYGDFPAGRGHLGCV